MEVGRSILRLFVMPCSQRCIVLATLILAVAGTTALSQQAESPKPPPIEASTPVEQLEILLRPMTKDELMEEVTVWRDRLKDKATQIAVYEVNLRKLKDDVVEDAQPKEEPSSAKADALAQLNRLRDEKAVLLDQFLVVVDAYETKGGDAGDFRKYAAAQGGITVDATDAVAVWTTLSGWVTSKEGGQKWFLHVVQFLSIMLVFWFLSRLLGNLTKRALNARHLHVSGLLKRFLNNMVRRVVLILGLLVALATVEVNVGALVALIGGGAFVLGFALQDTLSNFANGIMLFIYRPFDVGDAVDINGVSGTVDAVSLVNTQIRSWDNKIILVPNKEVWGKVITNMTGSSERRVDLVFGIGYGDDIDKARAVLERLVNEHPLTLKDPAPTIRVHELGDSSVNFIVRPWAKTGDYWTLYWDLTEQVKKAFDAEGISIPFPQRDVHLYPQGGASD